eukprot:110049-Karenia_brevis.AAC.1
MSPSSLLKRALVSLLLTLAQKYHLVLNINRDSADEDVRKSFRKIILRAHPDKAGGSEEDTKKLNDAYGTWQESFRKRGRPPTPKAQSSGSVVAGSSQDGSGPRKREHRFCSAAAMFTYQGFAGATAWPKLLAFIQINLQKWRAKYWCATVETNKDGSPHAHVMIQFTSRRDATTQDFIFQGIRPNVSTTDLCGEGLCRKKLQQSIDRGMFYVWANKVGTQCMADGTLCVSGNYAPCWTESTCTYQVLGKWPETLWKQRKISHDTWKDYLYKCRDGVVSRKRNLDAVLEHERRESRQNVIADRVRRIRSNSNLFKGFPEIPEATAWLQLFKHDALRYPVLIVLGRSHTGKTEWAKSLFKCPLVLRIGSLDNFPDAMRDFDRERHDGVILDDLRDLLFLSEHQDKVQGKYDSEVEFASTAGGTCVYYKDLFAVPFVATINYSTKNLNALDNHDFLSLPANRVLVSWPPNPQ